MKYLHAILPGYPEAGKTSIVFDFHDVAIGRGEWLGVVSFPRMDVCPGASAGPMVGETIESVAGMLRSDSVRNREVRRILDAIQSDLEVAVEFGAYPATTRVGTAWPRGTDLPVKCWARLPIDPSLN